MYLKKKQIEHITGHIQKTIKCRLIYIFGSANIGTMHKNSDIDIAVYPENSISSEILFSVSQECAAIFNRDVDLVDLSTTTTVLKKEVVMNGSCVFCCSEYEKQYFEMYTLSFYAKLNEERYEILQEIQKRGSVYAG